MVCQNCGITFDDQTAFCPYCGTPAVRQETENNYYQNQQDQIQTQMNNNVSEQNSSQADYFDPANNPYYANGNNTQYPPSENNYYNYNQGYSQPPYGQIPDNNFNQYYQYPAYQQNNMYPQPAFAPFFEDYTAQRLASNAFITGLIGFILSFIVPIAGLVLSIISLNKVNKYSQYTGGVYNNASTGRGFAIAGLIISIVRIIITFIYILVFISQL